MDFRAAFRFPFRGRDKWANLGLVLVCFLIPFVGGIVVIGYQMIMERRLIADIDAEAPRFDFGQFTNYLKIGLWPFLVSLVIMLPLMLLMYLPIFVGLFAIIVAFQKYPVLLIGGIMLLVIAWMLFLGIIVALVQPLVLKSGLEQTFDKAFSWTFFKSWWQKVGWLSVGVMLALMGAWFGVYLLTACTIIGPYVIVPVGFFVGAHVQAQLYRLYLERGGVPLVIQEEGLIGTFPVVPVVVPPPQAGP